MRATMVTTGTGELDPGSDAAIITAVLDSGVEIDLQTAYSAPSFTSVSYIEALARLRLADGTRLGPDRFIPVVESHGLLHLLTQSVLRQACDAAARWERQPDGTLPRVGVNVTAAQLEHGPLLDDIDQALIRSGLDPARLVVELTESAFTASSPTVARRVAELARRGVALAIDDFGSGMSSFGRLRELPVAMLKIDRCLVPESPWDLAGRLILETIICLGQGLGMAVVLEGVERPEDLPFIGELGADCAMSVQGYALSRPTPYTPQLATAGSAGRRFP